MANERKLLVQEQGAEEQPGGRTPGCGVPAYVPAAYHVVILSSCRLALYGFRRKS